MPHLTLEVGFTDPNWPAWGYSLTPLLQEIRRERRIELAGEGFRWDDLARWKAGAICNNVKTYIGKREPYKDTRLYILLIPMITTLMKPARAAPGMTDSTCVRYRPGNFREMITFSRKIRDGNNCFLFSPRNEFPGIFLSLHH